MYKIKLNNCFSVIICVFSMLFCCNINAQNISGTVFEKESKSPIEFVNVGILNKNIGTVTDRNGFFNLIVDSRYDNDSLKISAIGYEPYIIKIADFRKKKSQKVELKSRIYQLKEFEIKPEKLKEKRLGVTTTTKSIIAGFNHKDSISLGYEIGLLIKLKRKAYLKELNLNVAYCSYDSIFYRLNVYKEISNNNFENILSQPIFINLKMQKEQETINIDLRAYNIVTEGNFLISLEHVRDMGGGDLFFSASLLGKTYTRKSSQGIWTSNQASISLNVLVDVVK